MLMTLLWMVLLKSCQHCPALWGPSVHCMGHMYVLIKFHEGPTQGLLTGQLRFALPRPVRSPCQVT